jgi:hypothetical protein
MRVLRIVLFTLAAMLLGYRFLTSCCPLLPRYSYASVLASKRTNRPDWMV